MKCRVTARGIVVGIGALVMLLSGALLQDGELITLGGCGGLMWVICFMLARLNLRAVDLEVQLPLRFFAMRSVQADVQLSNSHPWRHARQVEIRMRFVHQVIKHAFAPLTLARSSSVLKERLSIPARAECFEVDCEIHSIFPLGLFEVCRKWDAPCQAMVYPAPITPPELLCGGMQPDHQPNSATAMGDLVGEPRGVRRYQSGDRMARIHQSATARAMSRGQGFQVRAYDPPGFHPQRCRVVFHSCAGEGEIIRSDRFDRALSLTVGTLAHLHRNQTKVTFQADFNDWAELPCAKRSEYIDCLTRLTTAVRAEHTSEQELIQHLQRVSVEEQLIIISDSPADQWAELVPASHPATLVINIRQVHFRRPGLQFQPQPAMSA